MGHVAQAEGDGHAVEMVVRERQFFRIGLDEFDVAGHTEVQQAVTTDLEHGFVDVGQHDLAGRAYQVREFSGQVASAAGDVEHAVTGTNARQFDRETLPQTVHAARQKVVHQVVLGGYRMENLSDFFRFLAFRNVFEAEVSGGFGIAAFALISHIAVTKRECATF
ncbi:hypothetical protein D3C80_519480 [compost metagenome]